MSLVFVPIVVLGILYIGFGYVLPAREQLLGSLTGVSWLAHVLPGCWLALSFGFNWVGCVVTNPGCTNSSLYRRLVAESVAAGVLPQRVSTDLVDNRFAAPAPWLQTSRQPQLVAAELHECAKQANVDEQFVWSVCRKSGALKPPLAHFCRVRGQVRFLSNRITVPYCYALRMLCSRASPPMCARYVLTTRHGRMLCS